MNKLISPRELRMRLQCAVARLGFDVPESKAIARNLWEAELAGRTAHGVARLALLRRQVVSGHIRPVNIQPEIFDGTAGSTRVDARGRTGWFTLPLALNRAARRLRSSTRDVAAITLYDAAPGIGYLGQYGRAIAARGMALIMMVKSAGGGIPEGSTKVALGTNPLCMAVPGPAGPIVLDMSTTCATWNSVELARLLHRPLPAGIAMDAAGCYTDDPHAAIGLKIFGGHRGTGLSIMIDLLAGGLGGSSAHQEQFGRWGVIAVIFQIEAFRAKESYLHNVRQTLDSLRSALAAQGESRYPGSESEKSLRNSLRQGWVELDARIVRLLDDLT